MHAVPASLKGQYVIRFTVTSQRTTAQVRSSPQQTVEVTRQRITAQVRLPKPRNTTGEVIKPHTESTGEVTLPLNNTGEVTTTPTTAQVRTTTTS
jgi:hypothetical protein